MKYLSVIFMFLSMGIVQAAEIKLQQGQLTLNANIEKTDENWAAGPVVLLTHGTLAHNGMEIISTLQELFLENGISSLAPNLSLGINDRHAMYDCKTPHTHLHTDALGEIGQWVQWLKNQGVETVVLMGHSRGGNQTAWYAAEHDDEVIKQVVLIAPQTWVEEDESAGYEKRYGKPLAPMLGKAKELAANKQGDSLLSNVDFIYCEDTSATADAIVSYYNPEQRLDTVYLLPNVGKPVLLFVGSEDKVSKGLTEKVSAQQTAGPGVELLVIEGADHYFRDLYAEELVEQTIEFINQ